jgi:hypothetical protein
MAIHIGRRVGVLSGRGLTPGVTHVTYGCRHLEYCPQCGSDELPHLIPKLGRSNERPFLLAAAQRLIHGPRLTGALGVTINCCSVRPSLP